MHKEIRSIDFSGKGREIQRQTREGKLIISRCGDGAEETGALTEIDPEIDNQKKKKKKERSKDLKEG